MKTASETLRERIYGSISKRAAESLKEEIEMLGRVRAREIEAAQDGVIQAVRRLEQEGQISLEADAA
jgi:flagellar motor switch protein FliG